MKQILAILPDNTVVKMSAPAVKLKTYLFLLGFVSSVLIHGMQGAEENEAEQGYRKVWVASESLPDGQLSDPVVMG